jgi:FKBP-type peptidyl-prolyl cis-trans isomerase SlyD
MRDHRRCRSSPCVVSLTWTLSDAQNRPIDELTDPVEFFYGGDDLLAKVEEACRPGSRLRGCSLHLEPEHAFGDYRPNWCASRTASSSPSSSRKACSSRACPRAAVTPDMPADAIYTVTEIYPSHVVLDGNHPLAGMALRLHMQVRDVREATEDEIAAQRRRGEGAGGMLSPVPPGHPATSTEPRPVSAQPRPVDPKPPPPRATRRSRRRAEAGLHHRHDDHLRDALQRLHGEGRAAAVPAADHQRPW